MYNIVSQLSRQGPAMLQTVSPGRAHGVMRSPRLQTVSKPRQNKIINIGIYAKPKIYKHPHILLFKTHHTPNTQYSKLSKMQIHKTQYWGMMFFAAICVSSAVSEIYVSPAEADGGYSTRAFQNACLFLSRLPQVSSHIKTSWNNFKAVSKSFV